MRWIGTKIACLALAVASSYSYAGPWVEQGDMGMRHDLQLLVDAGYIDTLTTTWPLPWGDIVGQLQAVNVAELSPGEYAAYRRLRERMRDETRVGRGNGKLRLAYADEPVQLRTFEATPREEGELSAGLEWTGKRFAYRIQGTAVSDPQDDEEFRLDGSYAGMALGNWMLSVNAMDRWWGPGWDGSLILSNNARPIPALMLERNSSRPFKTPWLSWMGPWKLVVFNGVMVDDRADYDNPMLFGARFTFAPLDGLELGLSRTAMWGGDGRPQDLEAFWNMLIGRDNSGEPGTGITAENEPGNQLAGYDGRWASPIGDMNYAFYFQWIGEDEKNNLPYRFLKLGGAEIWGGFANGMSWRLHAELAETRSESTFDYAYNHGIYTDGYRYYGRPIGHSSDNDSRQKTLGLTITDTSGGIWNFLLRDAEINGDDDGLNSVSPVELLVQGVQGSYQRDLLAGRANLGLGWTATEITDSGETDNEYFAYLQWQRTF